MSGLGKTVGFLTLAFFLLSVPAASGIEDEQGPVPSDPLNPSATWSYNGEEYSRARFEKDWRESQWKRRWDEWTGGFDSTPAQVALVGSALALVAVTPVAVAGASALFGRAAAFLALLFSRFQRNELLGQATRERVYAVIDREPGITFSELKRRLGLSTGVLYHHVRMLERHELVRSLRVGARRAYHRAGVRLPDNHQPLSLAQTRFLEALGGSAALTRNELAQRLGLTPQAVSHHAKALAKLGRVQTEYRRGQLVCRRSERVSVVSPPLPPAAPAVGVE